MPYFKTENGNAENIKYDDTKSVKTAIDEIKASSSSNPTAASVTFDNTDTGLAAANVQNAVTEVNGKLISYEIFSININITLAAKQQIYITGLSPHIPNGKSIVGFAGFADASYIILSFGTLTEFGQNAVRGYNPQDSAIGITQLKCVLFYA